MDLAQAVDIATNFIETKGGYTTHYLRNTKYDNITEQWELIFDVGLFMAISIKIMIDDKEGKVISYERLTS